MIHITIRKDNQGEQANKVVIDMIETGYSYVGTVEKVEISGPTGEAVKKSKSGHIAFTLTAKDVTVI